MEDGAVREILSSTEIYFQMKGLRNSHLEIIYPFVGNAKAITANIFHYSLYLDQSFVQLTCMINTFWQRYLFKSYTNESHLHIFFHIKIFNCTHVCGQFMQFLPKDRDYKTKEKSYVILKIFLGSHKRNKPPRLLDYLQRRI